GHRHTRLYAVKSPHRAARQWLRTLGCQAGNRHSSRLKDHNPWKRCKAGIKDNGRRQNNNNINGDYTGLHQNELHKHTRNWINAQSGGTTIGDGTLELASGASAGSGAIAFAGSGGVLKIDGATMPTNVINGLAPGDTLDFAGATFSSNGSVTLKSGNMLQLVE